MSKRWAVAGITLAAALACAPAASASSAPSPPPAGARFQVSTTAYALQFKTTQQPAFSIVTDDLIDDTLALASNHVDTQGGQAQGASFYPGLLIAQAPQLICQQFFPCGGFSPPQYPLLADATYPTAREATAPDAGRLATATMSADVAQASASAARDSATSAAGVADANVVAGLIRIGVATSASTSHIAPGVLRCIVSSSATGVDIGPLHIGSLETTVVITIDPRGAIHSLPRTVATGVSVSGQAASIDQSGVHLLGRSVSMPSAVLEQAGISVRLVPASTQDVDGAIRSSAAGLQVSALLPVTSAPSLPNVPSLNRTYVVLASLAGAGVVVSADDAAISIPPLPTIPALPPIAQPTVAVHLPTALPPNAVFPRSGPSSAVAGATSSVLGVTLDAFSLRVLMLVLLIGSLVLIASWRALAWFTWRREGAL